jgi:hypothetical protein
MHCGGYFLDNDGSICEICPKRGADGVWRYPSGRIEAVDDSICFDAGPDADGAAGTGGTGGSGGTGGTGGANDAGDAEADADAGDAGGGPGDGGDAEAEPYCDPTSLPGDDACVIADDYGIFVSPDGVDDASCGTNAAPCATITQGMARAKTEGKRVYACGDGGDYVESVTIDVALDGLALFGGFKCADWSYAPSTVRARVFPAGEGVAWTVAGVDGLAVHDFAIESRDATTPGASSFAAIVRNASGVVFKNSTFTAGDGAKGGDGVDGAVGANGPEPTLAQRGIPATCTTPPPSHNGGSWDLAQIICSSKGGKGGNVDVATSVVESGENGKDGELKTNLVLPVGGGGGTGSSAPAVAGGVGSPGAGGLGGDNGGAAAAAGVFTSAGFTPASGSPGTDGFPGQGGGGGGAGASAVGCTGASGGAGGMGGCGGKLGTSGKGGGSSVALLSWSSGVTLEDCTLTSASGGNGGRGGNGGKGGYFSLGADGGSSGGGMARGGDGGNGGLGGPGGSGSGGTGGPSHALVVHGVEPANVGTALTHGAGGLKGTGGQAQGGTKAPDGSGGDTGAILIVP